MTSTRSPAEILDMESKYFDLVWYARKGTAEHYREEGTPEEVIEGMLRGVERVERERPEEVAAFEENPDWQHGFNSGYLAALRWVTGAEEVFLDT